MEILSDVRALLRDRKADGLLITRRDNYIWLTGGNHNHVMRNTDNGVGTLVITQDAVEILADSSDCARLREEENNLGAKAATVPWYIPMEAFLLDYMAGRRYLSDNGIAGTVSIQAELVSMRMQMTGAEMAAYREAGALCADVVESVCWDAQTGQTENDIARLVCQGAIANGIHPDCVLVGSDDRIDGYRHPMPTDRPVQNSLMVVLGGEKRGLYISMTRMVFFSPPPSHILERYGKVQQIFAHMQLAMKDGLSYGEYFAMVQDRYRQAGYPDEWKLHHQGGPTGYACREFVVNSNTPGVIRSGQVYAWNPTITGVKCEETTWLHEKGIETLTRTGRWPVKAVNTKLGSFDVAEILLKHV